MVTGGCLLELKRHETDQSALSSADFRSQWSSYPVSSLYLHGVIWNSFYFKVFEQVFLSQKLTDFNIRDSYNLVRDAGFLFP